MDPDAVVAALAAAPDLPELSPAALWLASAVPNARAALDGRLTEPLARGLAGLGPVPDWREETSPGRAAWAALAAAERGEERGDVGALSELEVRTRAAGEGQVAAARAHVLRSPARVLAARRLLSNPEIPYALPGELHPLMVEVLAAGDQVLPALHVDHVRRITAFVADALVLDARALGLWFWPVLRSLAPDRLAKPLARLPTARRLPPGALGLAAAYLYRIGAPWEAVVAGAGPADQLLAALALVGDRLDLAAAG